MKMKRIKVGKDTRPKDCRVEIIGHLEIPYAVKRMVERLVMYDEELELNYCILDSDVGYTNGRLMEGFCDYDDATILVLENKSGLYIRSLAKRKSINREVKSFSFRVGDIIRMDASIYHTVTVLGKEVNKMNDLLRGAFIIWRSALEDSNKVMIEKMTIRLSQLKENAELGFNVPQ